MEYSIATFCDDSLEPRLWSDNNLTAPYQCFIIIDRIHRKNMYERNYDTELEVNTSVPQSYKYIYNKLTQRMSIYIYRSVHHKQIYQPYLNRQSVEVYGHLTRNVDSKGYFGHWLPKTVRIVSWNRGSLTKVC